MSFTVNSLSHSALGSEEMAGRIAARALQSVPAYEKFLQQQGSSGKGFADLPLSDKGTYLKQFSFQDLVGKDFANTFNIFSSSGSSGQPFYWPQLKSSHSALEGRFRQFLEGAFGIHERKTLAVVGLALGSWIGGDYFSWLLKSVAIHTPYPLAVFSPGNKHDEIIGMLRSASAFVDQFILACCPSAIGHLVLRAEQTGAALPLEKMRYIVMGEPFPEALRERLEDRAAVAPGEALMVSIYGSADTGVLGYESPASILLRKLALAEPAVAEELGVGRIVPHFFHQADPEAYLETVGDELCVTKWQGIPLVRYNLHDRVRLYRWPELAACFEDWAARYPAFAERLRRAARAEFALPGVVAVGGRADSCLILCGTNITEAMFDEAVRSRGLDAWLTGVYQARLLLENGRQRLGLKLEYRTDANPAVPAAGKIYSLLVTALGEVQPEFRDDWVNIYRLWDGDPDRSILKLDFVPWPGLSQGLESRIKQRGIVS